MLRGSMIVFSAIFSVLMLKRRLSRAQWGCIGLVCTGLALVGLSGMMLKKYDPDTTGKSDEVSTSQFGIGILLVLLASALNSVQGVFEEKLLKVGSTKQTRTRTRTQPLSLFLLLPCFLFLLLLPFLFLPSFFSVGRDDPFPV